MPTAADALFARYRVTRDPECLAQVFDALAPRLLRLAIHLARDGAGAEDLVQGDVPDGDRARGRVRPVSLETRVSIVPKRR